jgi:hypothetical protein
MTTPGNAARANDARAIRSSEEHAACDLYVPGHLVHIIQAKKAWESDDPVRWGRFEGVDHGCLVVRFLDGGLGRYRIHRPSEVARVAACGDKVRVSERWRLASISRRFEQLLAVCVALPDDPSRPCSVAPDEPASLDDLADRLAERGGFLVPGRQAVQLAGRGPEAVAGPSPNGGLDEVS